MRSINWIQLVLAGLLIVAAPCSASRFSIDDYLELPEPKDFQNKYHSEVREAVRKISGLSNLKSILEFLKSSRETIPSDSITYDIYETLENSADPEIGCNEELVNLAKSVFAQTRADQELEKKSAILVDKLLKPRLKMCTARIGYVLAPRASIILNGLFKKAFNLNKKQDRILFEKIKQLDLATDEINVHAMTRLAEGYKKPLDNFMSENCVPVNNNPHFDVINITRALGGRIEEKPLWSMDNEYRRICLAWERKRDAILENFKQQKRKNNGCLTGLLCMKS
jgi:hypothetical protein